jgi:formate/nitrite transporter
MENGLYREPHEIAAYTVKSAVKKARRMPLQTLLLAFLAGAFIAFAAEGSNMAAFNLMMHAESYGLGKALAGAIFGTGLMMVLIAGADLFTGNNLMVLGVLERKITLTEMFKNWLIVYFGNFLGAMFITYMIAGSGLLESGSYGLGAVTVKIATYKVGLTFSEAVILGVLCNWLVCIAVWMAYGAKDMTGKIMAIFFPIWLFITSGFEHSIANMYYVPIGILAKGNAAIVNQAMAIGVTPEKLAHLNWGTFFMKNLLPVTIGNLIGGAFFVGGMYWLIYLKHQPISSVTSADKQDASR